MAIGRLSGAGRLVPGPVGMAVLFYSLRQSSLRQRLTGKGSRLGLTWVLIAILLVQAGRLIWVFVQPAPQMAVPAPVRTDTSILTRFDPFAGMAPAVIGTVTDGFTLYGVSSDGQGGGSAIIGLPDGVQVAVAAGEAVAVGVVLKSVGPDHVTLSRGPSLSRLYFPDMVPVTTAATPAGPVAAPVAAEAIVDPARVMAQARLRPRLDGLSITGLTVTASGEAPELETAGLQSGDVILSVNGTALTSPQALNTLRQALANAPSAEISFERDGQRRMTRIRTRQELS